VGGALAFVASQYLSAVWTYRIESTVLSVGLAATLVFFVTSKPSALSSSIVVRAVAIASYSTYLTHALVIHVASLIVNQLQTAYWFTYFPLALALVAIVATLFYWAVELASIRSRDSWIPRRVESASLV
jgi:peptidoglycan/LPS O-acetylase OafA/YrhL